MTDLSFEGMDDRSVEFLEWCTEQGESLNTILARRRVLTALGSAATMTREEVEEWYATRARLSPATRNQDLSLLRGFYRWMDLFEHREDDPTRRLKGPKMPQGLPRPFSRDEVKTIFEHIADEPDLVRAAALGCYAGTRIEEAVTLDWSEYDAETNRIRVTGKGSKTRIVGTSPVLMDYLLPNTGGNVITGGGKPQNVNTFQRRINRAIHAAGVDGTYHCFRHRYVTVALARTGDLLGVSRAVGHASLNTTSRYAQLADGALDTIALAVAQD